MKNSKKITEGVLPCPFCGEAELEMKFFLDNPINDCHIQCMTCTTTGPNGMDEESATLQWNTRQNGPT